MKRRTWSHLNDAISQRHHSVMRSLLLFDLASMTAGGPRKELAEDLTSEVWLLTTGKALRSDVSYSVNRILPCGCFADFPTNIAREVP